MNSGHTSSQIHPSKSIIPINQIFSNKNKINLISILGKEIKPLWIKICSEIEIFRFFNGKINDSMTNNVIKDLQSKPILLVNGYQSNHLTWNFFAKRLWQLGCRNIFALELNDFTIDEEQYYSFLESAIEKITFIQDFYKSVILIGHSMGGILARYYIKRRRK